MQEKKIMCPICIASHGEYNEMYHESDGHYICVVCNWSVWPPDDLKPDELQRFMMQMSRTHCQTKVLPAGEALKGGSGNSKGKKHKQPVTNKPTTQKLYNQLYKQT